MSVTRARPAQKRFQYDAAAYQLLVISLFVWLIYTLATNTAENLELRGMLTGFGFLSTTAGFDIDFTLISKEEMRCLGDSKVEMWVTVHADSQMVMTTAAWGSWAPAATAPRVINDTTVPITK